MTNSTRRIFMFLPKAVPIRDLLVVSFFVWPLCYVCMAPSGPLSVSLYLTLVYLVLYIYRMYGSPISVRQSFIPVSSAMDGVTWSDAMWDGSEMK